MISNKCKHYICDTIIFFITTINYNFYLDAVKKKYLVQIVAVIAVDILYCRFLLKHCKKIVEDCIYKLNNLINLSGNRLLIILLNNLR